MGLDYSHPVEPQEDMEVDPPVLNIAFIDSLGNSKKSFSRRSFNKWERIFNSHGQTLQEIFSLRSGKLDRVADMVLYPESNDQVEHLVLMANQHNVMLLPCGGNTNVTHSLLLSEAEKRMIVSVDMTRMNKIKWVDKANMVACVEAGIYGRNLEAELKKYGMTTGHEPVKYDE